MVFSDQFIQISTKLPSSNVYGLGEHRTEKYRHSTYWKRWSFFSRDAAPLGDFNLYGVHPFYMNVEEDGNAHGVFLLNSNAMDVLLQPYPAITFRTIGGILDFFVFLGPTPEDVVRQYMQIIGFPMFPPYWSLGYQLSRWGYNNLSEVTEVSQRTINASIPYDVQFFDIDYMEEKKDFTLDENNFENLPDFIKDFQKKGRRVVIILDPAIPSNHTLKGKYPPLDKGLSKDIFIKLNGSILEGEVWPGVCYFPDFSNEKGFGWWEELCKDFYEKIKFDGLWVDMNEPANFVPGSTQGCEENKWNNPPYKAALLESDTDCSIYCKTLCMDAEQALGRHYDIHSLYGYFQTKVTFRTLQNLIPGKRPMVFSRSTYPSSHRYGGHWLGDNRSYWSHLRDSIPGILEFGLFGFTYIGSDICGFWEDTTEELCARWNQVGAFYPFARNHNAKGFRAQDPVAMGEVVTKATQQAVTARYQLLPYLYTLFYLSHTTGSTVARPLLHEFPKDKVTLDIDFQFLWGSALLISPAVFKGQTEVKAYFPSGNWFDFYTGNKVKSGGGRHISLEAPMNKINLHVRGGHILPIQQCNLTIKDSRLNPMELIVAPDEEGNAEGSLFWDDGETWETHKNNKYSLIHFKMTQNDTTTTLNIYPKRNAERLSFLKITIFDQSKPQTVSVDGHNEDPKILVGYNNTNKVLHLTKLNLNISEQHVIVIKSNTSQ
ncbi:sucrase-isomaltase, intestinal-like isoform X2 [Tachypleus tridentatus]